MGLIDKVKKYFNKNNSEQELSYPPPRHELLYFEVIPTLAGSFIGRVYSKKNGIIDEFKTSNKQDIYKFINKTYSEFKGE